MQGPGDRGGGRPNQAVEGFLALRVFHIPPHSAYSAHLQLGLLSYSASPGSRPETRV